MCAARRLPPDAGGGAGTAVNPSNACVSGPARARLLALLTLERLPGVGPVRARALLEQVSDATIALERALAGVAAADRAAALDDARRALGALDGLAAARPELRPRLTGIGEADYPRRLLELPDPPPVLFALGDGQAIDAPCVAIVGTRRATRYGERVARALATAAARAGACVVSGMATGIDGIAHRAALDAGGTTAAVLGSGVDVPYPAAHRALHQEIARRGLVLSEHPPGERAGPGAFPRRNRIIAALASVTIVVEAGVRSGALLTAAHALELGRTVAAVPGPLDAPESAGTNALLRDGAHVIADTLDVLTLLGLQSPRRQAEPEFTGDARAVWEVLGNLTVRIDELPTLAGLPVERCLAAVTELELAGAIVCELTGEVARRR